MNVYRSFEPSNGGMIAWYVIRVALVAGGLTSMGPGETLVRAPVGHTEEIRRNRRRKTFLSWEAWLDLYTRT